MIEDPVGPGAEPALSIPILDEDSTEDPSEESSQEDVPMESQDEEYNSEIERIMYARRGNAHGKAAMIKGIRDKGKAAKAHNDKCPQLCYLDSAASGTFIAKACVPRAQLKYLQPSTLQVETVPV
jgi:hypothetical protein